MEAGADVCRINCSHADHDSIRRQVAAVRQVAWEVGRPVGVLLDLQGPKIRTGPVATPLELCRGDLLTVVMVDEDLAAIGRIGTTYPQLAQDLRVGDPILFADGALDGEVEAIDLAAEPAEVQIRMGNGGILGSHKGINLPGAEVSSPSLTTKDLADLEVGVAAGVDLVALSFVRRPQDVLDLRGHLDRLGQALPIIAKIEKPEAVEHIDAICQVAQGVMVARGDLGVEVPIERVPVYQKQIINAAFRAGRMCITATQMLESMTHCPRPTRAETTDVANAILDGTDAVMLSGETAIGRYPVEAVTTMNRICQHVEASEFLLPTAPKRMPRWPGARGTVTRAACWAAQEEPRPLVVLTWSGGSAVYASKARPHSPIFALTPDPDVVNRLAIVWGVTPILIPKVQTVDEVITAGERALLEQGYVEPGQEIVILAGRSPLRGVTNLMRIHPAGSEL